MGELANYANSGGKFIKLKHKESYEGVYEGYRFASYDYNGKTVNTVVYNFDGKELSTGCSQFALQMDAIPSGAHVRVTRYGEGTKTYYEGEQVSKSGETFEEIGDRNAKAAAERDGEGW